MAAHKGVYRSSSSCLELCFTEYLPTFQFFHCKLRAVHDSLVFSTAVGRAGPCQFIESGFVVHWAGGLVDCERDKIFALCRANCSTVCKHKISLVSSEADLGVALESAKVFNHALLEQREF